MYISKNTDSKADYIIITYYYCLWCRLDMTLTRVKNVIMNINRSYYCNKITIRFFPQITFRDSRGR